MYQLPSNIEVPRLDDGDEATAVAEVIDALPEALTARGRTELHIQLIEALGMYYARLLYLADAFVFKVWLTILALVGVQQTKATYGTTVLTFTRNPSVSGDITIAAGTEVRSGYGASAVAFVTAETLLIPDGEDAGEVSAQCTTAGVAGNVGAGALSVLSTPIAGVDSVSNASAVTDGADAETVQDMITRAPLALRANKRAITDGDFVYHAEQIGAVATAFAYGNQSGVTPTILPGHVAVLIVAADLNQTDNADLRATVKQELEERTSPGVSVDVSQTAVRLIQITRLEVELREGYALTTGADPVEPKIRAALAALIRCAPKAEATQTNGQVLWPGEVATAVSQVAGVRRVGEIRYQVTDDYGATAWSTEAVMTTAVEPASSLGLLHYGHNGEVPGLEELDNLPSPLDVVLL